MKNRINKLVVMCGLVVGVLAGATQAAVNVYTLDPALSVLTQGGVLDPTGVVLGAPVPMAGQDLDMDMFPDPETLSVGYHGTITADVTATTIAILGGSATAGINPAGPISPLPGGIMGEAPANYGGTFDAGFAGFVDLATRELSFLLSTVGPTALAGGAFAADDVLGDLDSGFVDFLSVGLISAVVGAGAVDMGAFGLVLPASPAPAMGTLEVIGTTEFLVIPVDITFLIPGAALGSPADFMGTLTGELVATREIPEPASLSFFAVGGALMTLRRRK